MRWKAVLFDMNDTLVDTRKSHVAGLKETLELFLGRWSEGEDVTIDQLADSFIKTGKSIRLRAKNKNEDPSEIPYLRLKETLEPHGIPVTREFSDKFYKMEALLRHKIVLPHPGVKETFSAIHPHTALGIISNGESDSILRKVKALEIEPWIPSDRLFSSSDIGVRKPNKELFLHALKKMDVPPKDAIYVGNSWSQDVRGALRSGMKAVWFNPLQKKRPSAASCYEIHNLTELIPILNK
jgi:FMN phosphatase YigB (HAD superfamily)